VRASFDQLPSHDPEVLLAVLRGTPGLGSAGHPARLCPRREQPPFGYPAVLSRS